MKQSLVKIRVHTPFTFTHLNYEVEKFSVGVHSVAPEVAENWFIQEYAEIVDGSQPENTGVPAEALAQIADLQKQLAAALTEGAKGGKK